MFMVIGFLKLWLGKNFLVQNSGTDHLASCSWMWPSIKFAQHIRIYRYFPQAERVQIEWPAIKCLQRRWFISMAFKAKYRLWEFADGSFALIRAHISIWVFPPRACAYDVRSACVFRCEPRCPRPFWLNWGVLHGNAWMWYGKLNKSDGQEFGHNCIG